MQAYINDSIKKIKKNAYLGKREGVFKPHLGG